METQTPQNLGDVPMTGCRSFGSNHNPCSQSRKMSIGIVVDHLTKPEPEVVMKDKAACPTTIKSTSNHQRNLKESGREGERVTASTTGQQIMPPDKETSPWISTRSFNQKKSHLNGVPKAKKSSTVPSTSNPYDRSDGIKAATPYSDQLFANEMSAFQSAASKQKKFNQTSSRKKEGRDGSSEKGEEFETAPVVPVQEKEVAEDKTTKPDNRGSETLKMKLWEILGNVSSPNKQLPSSQDLEKVDGNLKPGRENIENADPPVKPRQNSDTIESDSQCPDQIFRRPVTRSLTRTRGPTKVQPKKNKNSPFVYKHNHEEKNFLSFRKGLSGSLCGTVHGGSSMLTGKKNERKRSRVVPRRMSFLEQDISDEVQRTMVKDKEKTCEKILSSVGDRLGDFYSFPLKKTMEFVESKNGMQQNSSHPFSVLKMTDPIGKENCPTLPEKVDHQEELANSSLKAMVDQQHDHRHKKEIFMPEGIRRFKNVDPHEKLRNASPRNIADSQYDLQSPTFELKTPVQSSSPSTDQEDLGDHSPVERLFTREGIHKVKSVLTSKPAYFETTVGMESSVDEEDLEDPPAVKSVPITEGINSRLSKSFSEEKDSEHSSDSSLLAGGRETDSSSPETSISEKPKFVLRPNKRHRHQEGVEESNGFREPSEHNQETELASAVTLFALALEKLKSKMNSTTSQRTAEIVSSVAEEIYVKLKGAESKIETDVGKLNNLGKTKRKHLEARFQEHQEQLKVIHERFRKEINHHLQDCRSTLEEMEAHQIEFDGILEKQKASHRKILSQAEEAIETELDDTQMRITAVQKFAREKMLQLRYVIAECLKEGILS